MKIISCICIFLISICSQAQQGSHSRTYNRVFTTYPFSDPDPVPDPTGNIYPYNHFDGYTNQAVQQSWKVVELENDFIKIMILPEIGGKIWSAVEKKSGKEFIYFNHVVKFRDVAMRGPWTSGGIEANYGTIGHTPNCAAPVDFTTFSKPDGSVSCVTGVLDLLTRTTWRMEINLPADKAYFTTRSFWFNASGIEQPYYHWMNAGIKAAGNLEFIYPGTNFIGHEGEVGEWPLNTKNNKAVSWYENNNFGTYKSYHVFGKYTNFFGGYWHDGEYGVVRYADHDDKPGKKLWIWGLSRQGMIWENLLSDKDGQYVEIQSGRLFNQSAAESALTPFKHRGFAPYATDTWTEYWYPVLGTKGYVAANPFGALNVQRESGQLKLYFSAVQNIQDTLTVMQQGKIIYRQPVSVHTLDLFGDSLKLTGTETVQVKLGNKLYWQEADTSDNISRPTAIDPGFNQTGMYGLYLQGKNNIYFRRYVAAEEKLRACLQKEPGFLPALADMSMLLYRKMDYAGALQYAKKALSINTYDPTANYYYGLINKKLGNMTDAMDGLDIASQSEEYRGPAFTELAKLHFDAHSVTNDRALHYAEKALLYNQYNTDALQVMAVAFRLQHNQATAAKMLERLEQVDPLNVFAKFERALWASTPAAKQAFAASITNEMPDQSMLELALWYRSIGCISNCVEALQVYPGTAETGYWLAYLHKNATAEKTYYQQALTASKQTAFAFRPESAEPLRWYAEQKQDWQPVYMLALLEAGCGNQSRAIDLLNKCGQSSSDAGFYSLRAKLAEQGSTDATADITKAIALDGQQWRYHKQLAELYIKDSLYAEALAVTSTYYKQHSANYIMGMLLAKTLLLNKKYTDATQLLDKITVIPYEGATDGRRLYKEAYLMQAVQLMQQKNYKKAIASINMAREWPERLGVGKPYAEDIDERLENFLLYQSYTGLGDKNRAATAMEQIKQNKANVYKSNSRISDWAAGNTAALAGEGAITDDNARVLTAWLNSGNKP